MPIVTHSIESSTQANGGANNTLRMYDQDGIEYTQTFYTPPDFNITAKVQNTILQLDEQLAVNEFQALIGL